MAIISSGIYPINPNVTDGTQLANYINELVTAINSNQASATRPPLITKGGVWTKLVNETDVDVMVYDGTTDFKVASIVNGEIIDVDGIPEAPADGKQYARQDENWTEVNHPTRLESNRNLIINGDMRIAQRGTSVAGITTGGYKTVDRFHSSIVTAGTWTMSQDSDVPTGQGFAKSLKYVCTTANASLSSNSIFSCNTRFEGQSLQQLKYGTANAELLTVSFWIKSNKTGTYIAELYSVDNLRQISKAYTISAADTWEKKTLTFTGDTTLSFDNDNNLSMALYIYLAAGTDYSSGTLNTSWAAQVPANRAVGQVNLADSTSNYINITGVQLEVGDTATPFEHRPYDMELARCQRYCHVMGGTAYANFAAGFFGTTVDFQCPVTLPTTMRATPSLSSTGSFEVFSTSDLAASSLNLGSSESTNSVAKIGLNISGATAGRAGTLRASNDTTARLTFTAEL